MKTCQNIYNFNEITLNGIVNLTHQLQNLSQDQIVIRICVWSAIRLKAYEKNFFRKLLVPGVASFLCLTRDDSIFLNQIEGWIYRGT